MLYMREPGENPYVPVSLSQRPSLFDPFRLARLGARRPPAVVDLVQRIEMRPFDLAVTLEQLQSIERPWCTDEQLVRSDRSRLSAGGAQERLPYMPNDRGAMAWTTCR